MNSHRLLPASHIRHTVAVEIRILTSADDLAPWAAFVHKSPQGSLWQSPEWKGYQEGLGRQTRVYGAFDCHGEVRAEREPEPALSLPKGTMTGAALVIIDKTAGNLATWEIPRGPVVGASSDERVAASLVDAIVDDAKKSGALCVFLSPPSPLPATRCVLTASSRHTQPEATRILSLQLSEQDLLAQMKPKGRYNIRLAERHDLEIKDDPNITAFHALLKRTATRDGFGIHPESHYRAFLEHVPGAFLLLAYHAKTSSREPIAGLLGAIWGTTGIYYYGASDERHRALMAPYLLQWHAMKRCKAAGCTHYDLLGVAPEGSDEKHAWAGITNFKEKFGGALVAYPPEQQVVLRPVLWKVLQLKRRLLG